MGPDPGSLSKPAPALLAAPACALAGSRRRLVRWNLAHVCAGCDEELGERPAEPAGAFDAPSIDRAELGRPHERSGVAVVVLVKWAWSSSPPRESSRVAVNV